MIPYITNRGGPMVGLEALSMQGLPVDELLLTRETEDQLADKLTDSLRDSEPYHYLHSNFP